MSVQDQAIIDSIKHRLTTIPNCDALRALEKQILEQLIKPQILALEQQMINTSALTNPATFIANMVIQMTVLLEKLQAEYITLIELSTTISSLISEKQLSFPDCHVI